MLFRLVQGQNSKDLFKALDKFWSLNLTSTNIGFEAKFLFSCVTQQEVLRLIYFWTVKSVFVTQFKLYDWSKRLRMFQKGWAIYGELMLTVNQFRGIVIEARLALLSVQFYRDGTQVLMCSRTAPSTVYAPQISVDIFKLGGEYCLLVGRASRRQDPGIPTIFQEYSRHFWLRPRTFCKWQ